MTVLEVPVAASTHDEWRSRATSTSWQDRAEAARTWDGLSISLAKRLARDADVRVRVALAERDTHRALPESVIADLFSSRTPQVRCALAGGIQPLTDKQSLSFISDPSSEIRRAFARSSRPLSPEITTEVASWSDPLLLGEFIRSGRELPEPVQAKLAQSPHVAVRHALAHVHGGLMLLSDDVHLILAMDSDPLVREAAQETITVDVLNFAADHDSVAVREAASVFVISLAIEGNRG